MVGLSPRRAQDRIWTSLTARPDSGATFATRRVLARVPRARAERSGSGGMTSVEVCAADGQHLGITVTYLLSWSSAVKDS